MTEFEKYFTGIYDGNIIACEKMKKVSEMLLNRFASPDEFHFDEAIATRHTDFIEKFCKQPSGILIVAQRLLSLAGLLQLSILLLLRKAPFVKA